MVEAIRTLLIEKEIVKARDVQERLDFMDSRGVEHGARIVVKAWTDPDYKARLMADGTAAVKELGIPMADLELLVVENTADIHNLIVCTLCSCYPRAILGLPPDWYKSKTYRYRQLRAATATCPSPELPTARDLPARQPVADGPAAAGLPSGASPMVAKSKSP